MVREPALAVRRSSDHWIGCRFDVHLVEQCLVRCQPTHRRPGSSAVQSRPRNDFLALARLSTPQVALLAAVVALAMMSM